MPVKGGRNLQRIIRRAMNAIGVDEIEVGFFSDSKYPDGTPVAAVAAANEFGTEKDGEPNIPERPFFRQGLDNAKEAVAGYILENVDGETLVIDDNLADEIGAMVQGEIQQRITDLREPPNAPRTLAAKKPKTNPLIDTGTMRTAVTYRTVKI